MGDRNVLCVPKGKLQIPGLLRCVAMMGRTHIVQAAATWLAGCAATTLTHHPPAPGLVLTGLAAISGAALLPDCDHRNGTLAQVARPVSQHLCGAVADLSSWVQATTGTRYDRPHDDGHRGLTHTLLAAAPAGGAATALAWLVPYGSAILVGVLVAFAAQALIHPARPGRLRRTRKSVHAWLIGWAAGLIVAVTHAGGWWLGPIVAAGWLIHLAGDACSVQGVPLFWPARIRGQRWRMVGLWRPLRIHTGAAMEHWHAGAATLIGVVSVGWMLFGLR
jgi:Predicted membrane-bound metal-dependent hydrolase (DUF457).